MIYLYFDAANKTLYAYNHLEDLGTDDSNAKWTKIETVTQDPERRQILAHGTMGKGIVIEFPESKTVLTCQSPENN